jgi:hypothetical protein
MSVHTLTHTLPLTLPSHRPLSFSSLKRLKELRLGGNPVSDTPALRYLVLTYSPRLDRLDGLVVSDQERQGRVGSGGGVMLVPGAVAMQSAMLVPHGESDDGDDDDDGEGGAQAGGAPTRSRVGGERQAAAAGAEGSGRNDGGGQYGSGISMEALRASRTTSGTRDMGQRQPRLSTAEVTRQQMDSMQPDQPCARRRRR